MKEPVEDPAATDTLVGTVTELLLLESNTVAPPVGAAFVSVTVQLANPPLDRADGVQISPDTCASADKVRFAVWTIEFAEAVMIAVWFVVSDPTEAENVTELEPAETVTVVGIVRLVLFLVKATPKPPAGAIPLSVTVHAVGTRSIDDTWGAGQSA